LAITAAQKFRLGVFVIAAIAIIVSLLVVGIGVRLSRQTVQFYSEFTSESLSGLGRGMDVRFRGIPIGKVTGISYNPRNLSAVRVDFEVEEDFPMKDDMFIEMKMGGITGLRHIEIMGGTNEANLLPPNSLVPSRTSFFGSITDQAESILASVETLLLNLNSVVHRDSLNDLFQTLSNISEFTANVNEFTQNLNATGGDLFLRIDTISIRMSSMAQTAEYTLNRFSEEGHLFDILANIDSTIVVVHELSKNFGLTFTQSREDFGATLSDLRLTMENLSELSAMLVDNPSLLLRGNTQRPRRIR